MELSIMSNDYKKGEYVVLLAGCCGKDTWKHCIPINHCYKLRNDATTYNFDIEEDMTGSMNGWNLSELSIKDKLNTDNKKLKLRAATNAEILMYEKYNKPFRIDLVESFEPKNYDYLIPLLKDIT